RSMLSEYEAAGIDVSSIKNDVDSLEKKLSEARSFISSDQLSSLSQTIREIKGMKSSIESEIESKRLLKFATENKEAIATGAAVLAGAVYLLTQILLPYRRFAKRLSEMRKAEIVSVESRKKTEKQYFRREIDENTFREIMIHEQEKILNTRAEIKNVSLEMRDLVKKKLNPIELVIWIITRPVAFAKWTLSLFKRGKKNAGKTPDKKTETVKPQKKSLLDIFKRPSKTAPATQHPKSKELIYDPLKKNAETLTLTLLEVMMKAKELEGKDVTIEECTIIDNGNGKYILKDLSGTLEGISRQGMAGSGTIKGKVTVVKGKPRIEF
ncbi:MAG: hypothetical protein HZB68_02230, partial [Candidatus Aenigmarchaeota archaeon]|nr:hypothetical protein [Candidatus Aenigmarchaeota archaeon]